MGGGQDKPAWTACPPGVKITRVGGKITRDSLPPGGQAVQGGQDKLLHRHNCHRALLSNDVRQDIEWWTQFLSVFNGKSLLLDKIPIECTFTDACDEAAGGSFGYDWFYYNWSKDMPQAQTFHINEKEVLAVVIAANRWAHFWRNKRVIIYSDNSVTVASINKASSRKATIMRSLRYLFWLSAAFNFHLTARFSPGIFNTVADSASRLHTSGFLEVLLPYTDYSPLFFHMSSNSLAFLLDRFPHWMARAPGGYDPAYRGATPQSYTFCHSR